MDYLYLLDTNIISEFSKQNVNESVALNFRSKERFCAVSAITLQELQFGMELLPEGKRKNQVRSFLDIVKRKFVIIPYESKSAVVYGEIAANAQKAGTPCSKFDTQIAATAVANNMTLVTRNIKDFLPLQQLCPLKLENWFA